MAGKKTLKRVVGNDGDLAIVEGAHERGYWVVSALKEQPLKTRDHFCASFDRFEEEVFLLGAKPTPVKIAVLGWALDRDAARALAVSTRLN